MCRERLAAVASQIDLIQGVRRDLRHEPQSGHQAQETGAGKHQPHPAIGALLSCCAAARRSGL